MTGNASSIWWRAAAVLVLACATVMAAGLSVRATGSSTPQSTTPPPPSHSSPMPLPSAKGCDLFKQLSAPTTASFEKHKLTAAQRSYVLKYVKTITPSERRYAKWMVDPDADNPHANDAEFVFDAAPVYPDDPIGSHASWVAVNTNVGLDPIECRMFATPIAYGGQVRPPNGRI